MDSDLGRAIRVRLVGARKRAGFTQEQAALRLGVSRQSISKWENGRGSPNPRELADLCAAYSASADWVLKGIASKPDTGSTIVNKILGELPPKDFADSSR